MVHGDLEDMTPAKTRQHCVEEEEDKENGKSKCKK